MATFWLAFGGNFCFLGRFRSLGASRIFAFFMSVQLHTALHCYCTINQSSLLHKRAQSARTRAIDLPFKLFLLKIVPLVNCPCTARARARNLDRRNSNKTPAERVRTTSERERCRGGGEESSGAAAQTFPINASLVAHSMVAGRIVVSRSSPRSLAPSLDEKYDLLLSQMNLYSYGSRVERRLSFHQRPLAHALAFMTARSLADGVLCLFFRARYASMAGKARIN